MNKAILVGNLTRDPEVRNTPSGVSCTTFTVACQRRFANQQGVREADFINCVAWRQTADFVARYFTKGSRIAVEGTIQTRSYDAQDGSKRYVTEIVVDNVEFAGGRNENSARGNDVPPPSAPPADMGMGFSGGAGQGASRGFTEVEDDELPF
jgi:single-strand DNA-binding protein